MARFALCCLKTDACFHLWLCYYLVAAAAAMPDVKETKEAKEPKEMKDANEPKEPKEPKAKAEPKVICLVYKRSARQPEGESLTRIC